jgi:hypothetical protein
MVAVKTRDGEIIPAPTQIVRLPKAGRTTVVLQGSAADTTLSSTQATTGHDTIADGGVAHPWLSVGNNSGTYGTTRALLKFPALSQVPTTSRVLEAQLDLWGTTTTTGSAGAVYELHALNRDFDETAASWNNAAATTPWTTPGGDMDTAVADTVSTVTNDPARQSWYVTSLAQSWVTTPASNKGVAVKLKDESTAGPQERTIFLSSEAEEPQLRPATSTPSTSPSPTRPPAPGRPPTGSCPTPGPSRTAPTPRRAATSSGRPCPRTSCPARPSPSRPPCSPRSTRTPATSAWSTCSSGTC